jgi:hypothetical protein
MELERNKGKTLSERKENLKWKKEERNEDMKTKRRK